MTVEKNETTFTTYQSIKSRQFVVSLVVEFLVRTSWLAAVGAVSGGCCCSKLLGRPRVPLLQAAWLLWLP